MPRQTETLEREKQEKIQDALKKSEERFRQVVESAPNAMVMVNRSGVIEMVNAQAERAFGYERGEMLGQPVEMLVPERFRRNHPGLRGAFFANPVSRPMGAGRDLYGLKKDGSEFPVEIGLNPIETEAGTMMLSAIVDISVRKQLEAEIRERLKAEATAQQAQKLNAIGTLTGSVAHDFNNVLTAVVGNLELALARASDPVVERFLRNAQHAAERGAKLADRLLSFARKQPLRREPCDLNRLIASFQDLLERTIGQTIDVELAPADDLWTVMADATQFEMALLNLAVNARDAMPHGGTLVIATTNVAAGSPDLPSDLASGDYACVSVRDTGTGMSEDVAAKVFEPFYTTKEIGKGTGLGLSQVYGFSKELGGTATLSSEVGAGTSVGLFLPRAPDAAAVASPAQVVLAEPLPNVPPNGVSVLVIDYDPGARDVAVEALRTLGFNVVAVESARRGLELLGNGPPVDEVVVDFSMPEMNGIEFIRRARLLLPDLPCLMVTGYPDVSRLGEALPVGAQILRKPYRMKELAATVDRLLAQVERERLRRDASSREAERASQPERR